MYRSIMEAIAYEYSIYLKIIKGLTGEAEFSNVIAIGGGSKSRVFNSIKADVLGICYNTLDRADTATFGSAVTAGFGVKIYDNIEETIDKLIVKKDEIKPDRTNQSVYEKNSEIYYSLYDSLENAYRKVGMAKR